MGARAVAPQDDGGASTARSNGKADREPRGNENERGAAFERPEVMRAANEAGRATPHTGHQSKESLLVRPPVSSAASLEKLLDYLKPHERIAVDTEADSLHCYREKLCLLQISVPDKEGKGNNDFIVDPLANVDLAPLRDLLEQREIVLHGADYDLRLLRRSLNFSAKTIFDTVIAARLL